VFHLAAIVSGGAEADFDLGWRVNVDGTRTLLELLRALGSKPRVVYTSSVAAFGGDMPKKIPDDFAPRPMTSYGAQKVIGELDSQGYAIITDAAQASPPPFDSQEVEKQIDTLPLAPFEETIARSFDSSAEGQMLRRIVLSRRYPQQVPNGPRLEDRYIQEMAGRASAAIQSIASALRSLPKEEFREEHVVLRDLVNRLPEGYERLQEALPDEEFK
jgi:hypothetical protein